MLSSLDTWSFGSHDGGERSVTDGEVIHGLHRRLDHLEGDLPIRGDRQIPRGGRPP